MVSLVKLLDDGASTEIGVVGREGMIGLPLVLGTDISPPGIETFVQIADGAHRMKAADLGPAMAQSPALRNRLFRYALARQAQLSQTAACNARHNLQERLARWLLMARDAVGSDALPLTHEFIAMMLGVRRPGVT